MLQIEFFYLNPSKSKVFNFEHLTMKFQLKIYNRLFLKIMFILELKIIIEKLFFSREIFTTWVNVLLNYMKTTKIMMDAIVKSISHITILHHSPLGDQYRI